MSEEEEFPSDVYFCDYCGRSFTKLGDKFRHIASEHKSEPAPDPKPPKDDLDA